MATAPGTTLSQHLRADSIGALKLREVCAVEATDSIEHVVDCMVGRKTGCALVLDESGEKLLGIFTERDLLSRVIAAGLDPTGEVAAVMTPDPVTLSSGASIRQAIEIMEAEGFRHLPITGANGRVVGVLSVKDIVHYLIEHFPANVYNLPPTPDRAVSDREGA